MFPPPARPPVTISHEMCNCVRLLVASVRLWNGGGGLLPRAKLSWVLLFISVHKTIGVHYKYCFR